MPPRTAQYLNSFYSHTPLVHNLEVPPLQEAAHLRLSRQYGLDQISGDLLPLLVRQRHIPLLQAQLSLSAEQQHELHLKEKLKEVQLKAIRG